MGVADSAPATWWIYMLQIVYVLSRAWLLGGTALTTNELVQLGLFACDNEQLIDAIYLCDGEEDCHDGSDEQECAAVLAPFKTMTCDGGKQLMLARFCDGIIDCLDQSDEMCNIVQCPATFFSCRTLWNTVSCIHESKICDKNIDCLDLIDEKNCPPNETLLDCGNGTELCANMLCQPPTEACYGPASFNNYQELIIDGESQPHSDVMCYRRLLCHNSSKHCSLRNDFCDGVYDCPLGDDERFCRAQDCPSQCECQQQSTYKCELFTVAKLLSLPDSTRALDLQLKDNIILDNFWEALRSSNFPYLHSLKLCCRVVDSLPADIFSHFHNLRTLDLSDCAIEEIQYNILSDRKAIEYVDLRNNPLNVINVATLISSMTNQTFLDADLSYMYCCYINHQPNAPQTNCSLLLTHPCNGPLLHTGFYQFSLILVILEPVLSLFVMLSRILSMVRFLRPAKFPLWDHLVFDLGLSGFTMGLHNLILSVHFINYGDQYYLYDAAWRKSVTCRFISHLHTLSSLVTAKALIFAAVHQFIATWLNSRYYYEVLEYRLLIGSKFFTAVILVGSWFPTSLERLNQGELYSPLCATAASYYSGVVVDSFVYCGVCFVEVIAVVIATSFAFYHCVRLLRWRLQSQSKPTKKRRDSVGMLEMVDADKKMKGLSEVSKAKSVREKCRLARQLRVGMVRAVDRKSQHPSMKSQHPVRRSISILICLVMAFIATARQSTFCILGLLGMVRFSADLINFSLMIATPIIHIIIDIAIAVHLGNLILRYRRHFQLQHSRFKVRRGTLVCRATGRGYIPLDRYLDEGGQVSVREVVEVANRLTIQLRLDHLDSRACDLLNLSHVLRSVDLQNSKADFELNMLTEYPKLDVLEWRQQRDIQLFGALLIDLLQRLERTG